MIDFAALTKPVLDSDACGPDLDLAGDPEYMNYVAWAESRLPVSYHEFKRENERLEEHFATLNALLSRTRDLRLMVLAAKFCLLNRDLTGFAAALHTTATWFTMWWEDFHPRPEAGDASLRAAITSTLDDFHPVILPLQYAPLIETRRLGPVSFRTRLLSIGEVKPREGEAILDSTRLDTVLTEADLQALITRRGEAKAVKDALDTISIVSASHGAAVSLDRLAPLAERIVGFLDEVVGRRDPSAQLAPQTLAREGDDDTEPSSEAFGAAPRATAVGLIASYQEASAALAGVAAYYASAEPSSPALLLVQQARQLMGKTFPEVIRMLIPEAADSAAIQIGREQVFLVPIGHLSSATGSGSEASLAGPEAQAAPSAAAEGRAINAVASRQEALAALNQVAAYYRLTEPSNPIPLLIERARAFAEQDFLTLLRNVLPEGTLKTL